MNKIGKLIKKQRLANKLKIDDVSKSLFISKRFIKAIENDEVETFYSKAYYDGYTKQYLEFLNLDHQEYFIKQQQNKQKLAINIPIKDKLKPSFTFALVAIILTIITYQICSNYINNINL